MKEEIYEAIYYQWLEQFDTYDEEKESWIKEQMQKIIKKAKDDPLEAEDAFNAFLAKEQKRYFIDALKYILC